MESAMRAIGDYIAKKKNTYIDLEKWGVTALLHDADYELTRKHPEQHTLYLEEKMGDQIPPDIMYAIKAHNYAYTKVEPISMLDWALYTCDELTGFIDACVLDSKSKKIHDLTPDIILEKLLDSSYTKSVNRDQIYLCEKSLGIPIRDYVQIVLSSMQAIDTELGL